MTQNNGTAHGERGTRLERSTGAREREPLSLGVDVTRLHFFDPETGTVVGESPGAAAP